jgi:hypothetical protein
MIRFLELFALSIACFSSEQTDKKQPNIIYILSDDLGHGDVGFTGGKIETPNLDRLAKEGKTLAITRTSCT